ncbi:hypothetical protein [Methylocystis parvus]|uniref:hypothetical protein n=1 Tax=Methylocystis parvus TaxID=134 RepID=UPI003C74AA17
MSANEKGAWIPNYSLIANALGLDKGVPDKVTMSREMFLMLMRAAVAGSRFDEEAYLQKNPDIKKAVDNKSIADPKAHYVEAGYFEGRAANFQELDVEWYLGFYKDVASALKDGTISSAEQHYYGHGLREWRAPDEAALPSVHAWRKAILGI